MSGITMSYRLEPRRSRPALASKPPKAAHRKPRGGHRTARMLALANHIERLVDDGVLADYATAARMLGLTSARMTQVMNLLQLAAEIQERLLLGTLSTPERRLRATVRIVDWNQQIATVDAPA